MRKIGTDIAFCGFRQTNQVAVNLSLVMVDPLYKVPFVHIILFIAKSLDGGLDTIPAEILGIANHHAGNGVRPMVRALGVDFVPHILADFSHRRIIGVQKLANMGVMRIFPIE